MKSIAPALLLSFLLASSPAIADQCTDNYKSGGSLFRGKTYETFADFPSIDSGTAFKRLVAQIPAEGFTIVEQDESTGIIKTTTKISAKSTAPAEFTMTPLPQGTRVHFSIALPAGAWGNDGTRSEVCRYISLVQIDPATYHPHPLIAFVRANVNSKERVAVVDSDARARAAKVAAGALAGALLGAAHAKLTGGDIGKEAALGALAGGALTFAITTMHDRRMANRDDVVKTVSYEPRQGYRAGIESVTITPAIVRAGGKINVVTTYWAISPSVSESFGMYRFAGITLSGAVLRGFTFNPQPFQFTSGGGQYETTMEIQLPQKVSPGEYSIQWVVDGESNSIDKEATFTVAG